MYDELKAQFKSICINGEKGMDAFDNKAVEIFLLKRYSKRIAEELLKFFEFPDPCKYEDYLFSRNNFITQPRLKTLKFAFHLYDEDNDGIISSRDLYSPFVTWAKKLYEDVFILDLDKMMPKINEKKVLNELTGIDFDEFDSIFKYEYPAVIKDIAQNALMYQYIDKQLPTSLKLTEKEKYDNLIASAYKLLGKNITARKIIEVYKILAIDSQKSTMHITKESLENKFVV